MPLDPPVNLLPEQKPLTQPKTGRAKFSVCRRLKGKRKVDRLFKPIPDDGLIAGNGFSHPFKLWWHTDNEEQQGNFRFLIIVPKRNFKRANKRNRVKRLIREALRKHQQLLRENTQNLPPIHFALMYVSKELLPFTEVEKRVISTLVKLKRFWQATLPPSPEVSDDVGYEGSPAK